MKGWPRAVGAMTLGLGLLAGAAAGRGAEPDPEDPPICRAAIEAHPEMAALAALAEEEKRLASDARKARREARKLMRETLGAGAAARAKLPVAEAAMAREADARRAGRALCLCRSRRGDPHREDCEQLYPMVIR